MIEHKQIIVFDPPSNGMIEVDEGIAPLLKTIWDFGITTSNSCQENRPEVVWIEFPTTEDAEAFSTRVICGLVPFIGPDADNWRYFGIMGKNGGRKYNEHANDTSEYLDDDSRIIELNATDACEIALSLSVRFPVADYERLLEMVGDDYDSVKNNL